MRSTTFSSAATPPPRALAEGARVAAGALLLLVTAATALVGQEARRLSLAEAISIAQRSNPGFQMTANDQAPADWNVREAYGQFLPSVTASGSAGFTEAGVQRFGTVDLGVQSTDWYSSSYGVNANWSLSGSTIFGLSSARAAQDATAANIRAARFTLETQVTLQYMAALRARDALDVARDQFERAGRNAEIVRTRVEMEAVAGTEGRQAEVDVGRAQVALLRAERLLRAEKLRLMEQLGETVEGDLELVSEFSVFEPAWSLDELLQDALAAHPSLEAARAQEGSTRAQVRQARSSYFPSINVSTGLRGFTQKALNDEYVLGNAQDRAAGSVLGCQRNNALASAIGGYPGWEVRDCSALAYTDAMGQAALEANDAFPFDFTRNPVSVSLTVSMPVFQGFSRQRQVEQAQAASSDAAHLRRQEELRLRTAVTQSLDNLESAWIEVQIEERNLELATQRLTEARQRYEVGNTSILELMDSQTSLTTAQRDHLVAVYNFHQSLVALEAATGRSLRSEVAPAGDSGS